MFALTMALSTAITKVDVDEYVDQQLDLIQFRIQRLIKIGAFLDCIEKHATNSILFKQPLKSYSNAYFKLWNVLFLVQILKITIKECLIN